MCAGDFAILDAPLELTEGFIWIDLADNFVLKVCGSHRIWILLFAVIASHGNCVRFCVGLFSHLAILDFVFWEFTKEL